LVKGIFDSLPRIAGLKDAVGFLDWFSTIRKDQRIKAISTAIAREPAGESRIQKETFGQVFERMERELEGQRQVDWPTVVEYFTKRGRPLTPGELLKLRQEDREERQRVEQRELDIQKKDRKRDMQLRSGADGDEGFEQAELRRELEERRRDEEKRQFERELEGVSDLGGEEDEGVLARHQYEGDE